eukprot:scaffold176185_cov13-Tisochrysis_lutea.AAC.1
MDVRKAFVLNTIASAIASADQRVSNEQRAWNLSEHMHVTAMCKADRNPCPTKIVQDAYVQYLSQDANGALASFLDDANASVLV